MQAPKVNSWWVNKLDGKVMFEFEYEENNVIVVDLKTLSSEAAANNYLYSIKRHWLMQTLEDWLNHKRHIIEAYPTEEKQSTFKEIWTAYCEMTDRAWSLEKIAARVVKGKNKFFLLLPSTDNKSYDNSVKTLMEVVRFCEELQQQKEPA